MANHEIVPGSAFTKGTAERRKSATSFSLPVSPATERIGQILSSSSPALNKGHVMDFHPCCRLAAVVLPLPFVLRHRSAIAYKLRLPRRYERRTKGNSVLPPFMFRGS